MIWLMRFAGTRICRDSSVGLTPSSSSSSARISPGWIGVRAMVRFLSVVVHDFNIRGSALPLRPFETDPPLHIDSDTVLALAVAFHALQRIRWQRLKVWKAGSRVKNVEALFRLAAEGLELLDALPFGKFLRPLVALTLDHCRTK